MRAPAMLRCAAAAAALAVLLLVAVAPAAGFYLPGVAPNDFAKVGWIPIASPLVHPLGMALFVFRAGSSQRGWDRQIQLDCPCFMRSFHDARWSGLGLRFKWLHLNSRPFSTVQFWFTLVMSAMI